MEKEEILEKSRRENAGQDLFDREIVREGGEAGIYAVYIAAAVFVLIGILVYERVGYDLFAMAYSLPAVGYTRKARGKKLWQDILLAAVLWGAVLLNAAMHFRNLLAVAVII